MPKYRVARRYSAVYRSTPIAFAEGATVELDPETAEWVNNDSPDCLTPIDPAPAPDSTPAESSDTAVDPESPAATPVPVEPPRSGTGSGLTAWQNYATAAGITVADDASRDDIIAAVDTSAD